MTVRVVALLALLALSSAGCGGAGGEVAVPAALHGDWVLTSGTTPDGPVEMSEDLEVTLTIDGSSWGGQVCNSYQSDTVQVGDGTVSVGDVPRTEMACADQQLMIAEDRYLSAFTTVSAYEVGDDELRLTGDGVELTYAPVAPVAPAALVGTTWQLDTVLVGSGPDGGATQAMGDPATLELHEDGTTSFGTGCNQATGSYELDAARITFGPLASTTEQVCLDGRAELEAHVLAVLTDATVDHAIEARRLTLTVGERGLSFTAVSPG